MALFICFWLSFLLLLLISNSYSHQHLLLMMIDSRCWVGHWRLSQLQVRIRDMEGVVAFLDHQVTSSCRGPDHYHCFAFYQLHIRRLFCKTNKQIEIFRLVKKRKILFNLFSAF